MAKLSIDLRLQDLAELIGDDSAANIKIRQSIAAEFSKRYLKGVAESPWFKARVATFERKLKQEFQDTILGIDFSKKSRGIYQELHEKVKEEVRSTFNSLLASTIEKEAKETAQNREKEIEKRVEKKVNNLMARFEDKLIEKRVNQRVEEALSTLSNQK